jgi:hypothetical protein
MPDHIDQYIELYGVPHDHRGGTEPDDLCGCEMCYELQEAEDCFDIGLLKELVEAEAQDRDMELLSIFTDWWSYRGCNMFRPLRDTKNPFNFLNPLSHD